MPSRDPVARFDDILENIARIERYTAGMAPSSFVADSKTVDAVERCLSRISEAAVKLGVEAETLCPDVPWRDIRGLGNRLRHEYATVDPGRIWLVVKKDLEPLKAACEKARARLGNG